MSCPDLREELERIAATAPVAHVPADTFARGRRARRRELVLVSAAVVAVLALVAGTALWLPTRERLPVASEGSGLGVPDHVYLAPSRLAQQGLDLDVTGDVESTLALGPVAVGYVSDTGVPVLVDATTGDYHLVLLPGFDGRGANGTDGPGLSLSPDGRQLAYPYVDPLSREAGGPMPAGVRVLDLDSGEVTTTPLEGGRGVRVSTISWSPDGSWLVWNGVPTTRWDAPSSWAANGSVLAGRIRRGAVTSQDVPAARLDPTRYAVADDGEVAVVSTDRELRWDGRTLSDSRRSDGPPIFTGYVDGTAQSVSADSTGSLTASFGAGRLDVSPLAWLDSTHLLARGTTPDGAGGGPDQLIIVSLGESTDVQSVGVLDPGTPPVTVAAGLVSLDRPTVARPAPGWPWSDERKSLVIGTGVAALVAAYLGLRLLWRRRRRRA